MNQPSADMVNSPPHYQHPSGVECIEISEFLPANLSHAFAYVFRYGDKENPQQDLSKALWYIEREIKRRNNVANDDKYLVKQAVAEKLQKIVSHEQNETFRHALGTIVAAAFNETETSNLEFAAIHVNKLIKELESMKHE